jgi:2-polyprenyl-6-methoxyphenol hydroxylase-like FAD-dependent oxidoreductase
MMNDSIKTDVCIVGGGPAGLTLALELVKRNLDVVVIEQSKEYNRTFRGESVSPDSVCILDNLGILKKIQQHGLITTQNLEVIENNKKILDVDFKDFKYDYNYPIDLPQPVLLEALVKEASRYKGFQIWRGTICNELIKAENTITGIKCKTPEGIINISAHLTVGADGRFSRVRELAECDYQKIPLKRDFMWFKLPLPLHWNESTYRVKIVGGHHALFIPTYPKMLRVGFNIPKGSLQEVKKQGIQYLHEMVAELEPDIANSVKENVKSWSDTSVLEIFTTVVPKWYRDGLVLIGDAAHTLSPVLAQGVNHAIIDAVTLAPIVAKTLKQKPDALVSEQALKEFQALRENDIKLVRSMQLRQEKIFSASSHLMTFLRRTVYRIINANNFLKSKIWTQVYYRTHLRSLKKTIISENAIHK